MRWAVAGMLGAIAACSGGSRPDDPPLAPACRFDPAPPTLATMLRPTRVIAADVDGDGTLDLITAHALTHEVGIARGVRGGGFAQVVHVATGEGPAAIVAADFDRDGDLDLATADAKAGTLSVLVNAGDGTYATRVERSVGLGPAAIAVGDVNGDGWLDLVVADRAKQVMGDPDPESTLAVLVNTAGTFASAALLRTDLSPEAVQLGDVDGDGHLDIIDGSSTTGRACVHRGVGDATFAARQCVALDQTIVAVAVADVDGDGALDVATAGDLGVESFGVQMLRGRGDGSWQAPTVYATTDQPHALVAADVDGDQRPELVIAGDWDAAATVLRNRGDGTFEAPVSYLAGARVVHLAVADLDGDAHVDLAVAAEGGVAVLAGHGDARFAAPALHGVGDDPRGAALGDVDGDGLLDVAVASDGRDGELVVVFGADDRQFTARTVAAGLPAAIAVAIGELTGDAHPDIVVTGQDGALVVLAGLGGRAFAVQRGPVLGPTHALTAADLDRDGRAEIVAATAAGIAIVSGGDVVTHGLGDVATSIAVGDLDGDGVVDLVATLAATGVAVLRRGRDGAVGARDVYATGPLPVQVAIGRLGDDAVPDLVVANSDGTISVLRGTGDAGFATQRASAVGAVVRSVAIGDVTGDGRGDVVAVAADTTDAGIDIAHSDLRLLASDAAGALSLPGRHPAVLSSAHALIGDVDGDLHADVVTVNAKREPFRSGGSVGAHFGPCLPRP